MTAYETAPTSKYEMQSASLTLDLLILVCNQVDTFNPRPVG